MAALLLTAEFTSHAGPSHAHMNAHTTSIMKPTSVARRTTVASRATVTRATISTAAPKAAIAGRPITADSTPGPSATPDPLQSASYLVGPLRTIHASLNPPTAADITDNDLAEAYALFAERTEACASRLQNDSVAQTNHTAGAP